MVAEEDAETGFRRKVTEHRETSDRRAFERHGVLGHILGSIVIFRYILILGYILILRYILILMYMLEYMLVYIVRFGCCGDSISGIILNPTP